MSKEKMPPMKRKINFKTLGRTIKMLFGFYPVLMPITVFCILFSAACATLPGIFIQNVIEIIGNAQEQGLGWAEASHSLDDSACDPLSAFPHGNHRADTAYGLHHSGLPFKDAPRDV